LSVFSVPVVMSADSPRSYSNFARAFPAQITPFVLNKASTDTLLDHPVKVYQQTKNKDFRSNSGNIITFNCAPSGDMTLRQFLQNYTMWFASIVLKEEQLGGISPFESGGSITPHDLEVAVAAISSIPDVDTLDSIYYDYMKDEDVTNLGYYVKDQHPVPKFMAVSDKFCVVIGCVK
jgi:hypothetical protein